jgi:hypothetical protein
MKSVPSHLGLFLGAKMTAKSPSWPTWFDRQRFPVVHMSYLHTSNIVCLYFRGHSYDYMNVFNLQGQQLEIMGFTPRQRVSFAKSLMRYGLGDNWIEMLRQSHHLKRKTDDEMIGLFGCPLHTMHFLCSLLLCLWTRCVECFVFQGMPGCL